MVGKTSLQQGGLGGWEILQLRCIPSSLPKSSESPLYKGFGAREGCSESLPNPSHISPVCKNVTGDSRRDDGRDHGSDDGRDYGRDKIS